MFGIGNIVSKALGGVLDKVGLGKITPFLSVGINALTGNWPGVAADVAGLANRLTGGKLGFLNKIAQFAPLAKAFMGGGANLGELFKGGKIGNLLNNFKTLTNSLKGAQQGFNALQNGDLLGGASKILNAFKTVDGFLKDRDLFAARSTEQHRQFSLGNGFGL